MVIQHNVMAMNSYRNLGVNNKNLSSNLEKLSSGYKINRAGDDAAGLAISEKMRAQITGLDAAQKNVNDGISLVKTSEGAMQEIQDMLNRMEYLAEQSANGTYENDVDRENLQKEVDSLRSEINRIADSANFNGIKLMNGERAGVANISTGVEEPSWTVKDENGNDVNGNVNKTTMSFGGQSYASLLGNSFSVDGTEFTFVATDNGNANEIVLAKTDTAEEIASKVANALLDEDKGGFANAANAYDEDKDWTIMADGTSVKIYNNQLKSENDTWMEVTQKNISLQIGESSDSYNQMAVSIGDMHTHIMGLDPKNGSNQTIAEIDISNQEGAQEAVQTIKSAINYVSGIRGDLGAIQNRLEHTNNNLAVMEENITDAESTIRDTDVAEEMMDYTKNNILIQSAQAMLAQANQVPQGVLQLMQ